MPLESFRKRLQFSYAFMEFPKLLGFAGCKDCTIRRQRQCVLARISPGNRCPWSRWPSPSLANQIPKAYCSRVAGIFGISDGISDISYPIHFSSRYSVYTGFRTSLFVCDWDLVRAWYLLIVGEGSSACWFFCENYVGSWAWNLQRLRRLAVRQPSSTCDTLCAVQESQSPRSFKTKSVDTNETSDTREMISESGLGRKLQVPGPCGDWERNRKNWNPMKPIVPSCSIVFQTVHI